MTANTKIEWADHTFNPWVGCTKVSPACDHCYAESWAKRSGMVKWGAGEPRRRTSKAYWRQPLKWNAQAAASQAAWEKFASDWRWSDEELRSKGFIRPHRPRVFCASLADVFDNDVPVWWRADLFEMIVDTPNLDWLLLTKRIGNAPALIDQAMTMLTGRDPERLWDFLKHPWANVWLGATVANQEEADRDVPKLLSTPAAVRFLSMEPLLGPVDLTPFLWGKHDAVDNICQNCPRDADCECGYHTRAEMKMPAIDWVIVGGESGPGARPMHPDWACSLRNQCTDAGVPFFFKQWGEWIPMLGQYEGLPVSRRRTFRDGTAVGRAGKRSAGRRLDGRTWDEVPR